LKNAPPHAVPNDLLDKLAENPEFFSIVDKKKNINEINKLVRIVQKVDHHIAKLQGILDFIEKELGAESLKAVERDFLFGDSYTLADIIATVLCARIYLKFDNDMFGPRTLKYFTAMQ